MLFALLTLCLSGTFAGAQGAIAISGTPVQLGVLTGGGWDGSQEPVGGTFVVGVNGDVLVGTGYGSSYLQMTPSGVDTTLAAGVGGSAAALDAYGNLYFGGNYDANVYKVPYDAATGSYVGWTGSAPTTNCQGGNKDSQPCIFAPAVSTLMNSLKGSSGNTGFAGVAFDEQGNFFFESNTLPGTNPNSIYECDTSCISNSSATPTLIYSDSATIGALAIDPWGDIFFVDGNNSTGKVTHLNELSLQSGNTYPSSPTAVVSYTNAAGYGNGISGLAIAGNGTLYISTNGDGLFAIPNTKTGGPNVSGMYLLATQGAKGVALDTKGNLYGIPYNSGDVVSFIPVNNFPLGAEPAGTAAAGVTATIIDSSGSCTPTLAATVTQFGVTSTEFTATAGTTCSTAFGGTNGTFSSGPLTAAAFSSFSVSIGFTPGAVGTRDAALTVSDSTTGATGVAALTGTGQGVLANLDPGVSTAYTSGLTAPASVVADAAGDVFVSDSSAGKVFEFASGSTTPVSIGSGFMSPRGLAFDANGNLFVADDGVPEVEEILNTGKTGAFTAGAQNTVISATFPFGGAALKDALSLAIGPDGTLYIADTGNSRVVSYNPNTGQAAVTNATATGGLASPVGVAVDGAGNLYVADSGNNEVYVFPPAGGVTAVKLPGVAHVSGVAVDASGSIIVSDATSGAVVRIPNQTGTLTTAQAVTIENVSSQASSVWLDSMGNLYVAGSSTKSAYAIQRTAAAIDLGTVQNGLTNSGTVYLENAGNLSATLATPAITQPANTMFTLAAGSTNGCSDGSTGPAGSSCELTATFAPLVGTANGVQTGTASVNLSTPAESLTVNLSGTASQSSVLAQTITNFNPPAAMQVGQQAALSATGGASGNPVVFSIDAASSCSKCASVSGSVLTALAAGTVTVDANQAGGQANGNQYAAAQQVRARRPSA